MWCHNEWRNNHWTRVRDDANNSGVHKNRRHVSRRASRQLGSFWFLMMSHAKFACTKHNFVAHQLVTDIALRWYLRLWKSCSEWKVCKLAIGFQTHRIIKHNLPWWRHQMETFSALMALCPVPGELPSQRPVTRSFAAIFDLRLNKRLSKQ